MSPIESHPQLKNIGPTAVMYRAPMKPEQFMSIITHPGAIYDICVESGGNPDYIDRDEIGFKHGILSEDAAFQPNMMGSAGAYEFAGDIKGQRMVCFGSIPIEGSDRDLIREKVLQAISLIYGQVVVEQIPYLELSDFIKGVISEINDEISEQDQLDFYDLFDEPYFSLN